MSYIAHVESPPVTSAISLERLEKVYADGTTAVAGLDLVIDDGELLVLVGPSGCGKTTALRMVAGLEEITSGVIRIGDRIVNDVPSRNRDIAMVFQSYALYPHLSVYENIAFGLRVQRLPKDQIAERVRRAAALLDLDGLLERKPRALSGGQRQRVAMGRAIVRRPRAFLMDEPLSNLDAKLRTQMRAQIAELQAELGVTTLYVTHDQVEAMTMGDRVAVMRKGDLQQVAAPQRLYDRPLNLFVAGFIGSPPMNLLEGVLEREGDVRGVRIGKQLIELTPQALEARPALTSLEGADVIVGVRPEDLQEPTTLSERSGLGLLDGRVRLRESLGSETLLHLDLDARNPVTDETRELAHDVGAADPATSTVAHVVCRFPARSRVDAGARVSAAVAAEALHFFDPATGLAIYA